MEFTTIALTQIEPNKGQIRGLAANPRTWSNVDVELLANSIRETPELLAARGLLVIPRGDSYVTIGGNMRLAALRQLGEEYAPCIVIPENTTTDKLRELSIKDNGSFGNWDIEKLQSEWSNLPLSDWGVTWEQQELPSSTPLEDIEEDTPPAIEEDTPSETRLGDVYRLGNHILVCGDSTDVRAYEFMEERASVMLTDPPYNVSYQGKTPEAMNIENDKQTPEDFAEFLGKAFKACTQHLIDGAALYVWEAAANEPLFREAFDSTPDWRYLQTLIWVKSHFALGHADYHWQHEPCLYGHYGSSKPYFIPNRTLSTIIEDEDGAEKDPSVMKKSELVAYVRDIRERMKHEVQTTVLRELKPLRNNIHPTLKPLKLFGRLIRNSSREDDTILDIFAGGGTTLIASEKLGRKSYNIELDPKYCDAIMSRYWQHTGKDPELITNYIEQPKQ